MTPPTEFHGRALDAAREAVADRDEIERWAERFALLSDPSRLALLHAIHCYPGIRVSEMAEITDMVESTVSHALRLLRSAGWVTSTRDGRAMRYTLADDAAHRLLHIIGSGHAPGVDHVAHGPEHEF